MTSPLFSRFTTSLPGAARALAIAGAAGALALSSGACKNIKTSDGIKIRPGMQAVKVPGKYGMPDVVSQTRDGETRWGELGDASEWLTDDKDVVTRYYYMDRGYKLVIRGDEVVDSESITREEFNEASPRVRQSEMERQRRDAEFWHNEALIREQRRLEQLQEETR